MSEAAENQSAPAFDNRTLIPYLRWIVGHTDPETGAGPTKDDFTEAFNSEGQASKIRQSLYIGKLAKGDKITGELTLTDAGRELLESAPAGEGIGGTDNV